MGLCIFQQVGARDSNPGSLSRPSETISSWPRWPHQFDEIGVIYPCTSGETIKYSNEHYTQRVLPHFKDLQLIDDDSENDIQCGLI